MEEAGVGKNSGKRERERQERGESNDVEPHCFKTEKKFRNSKVGGDPDLDRV